MAYPCCCSTQNSHTCSLKASLLAQQCTHTDTHHSQAHTHTQEFVLVHSHADTRRRTSRPLWPLAVSSSSADRRRAFSLSLCLCLASSLSLFLTRVDILLPTVDLVAYHRHADLIHKGYAQTQARTHTQTLITNACVCVSVHVCVWGLWNFKHVRFGLTSPRSILLRLLLLLQSVCSARLKVGSKICWKICNPPTYTHIHRYAAFTCISLQITRNNNWHRHAASAATAMPPPLFHPSAFTPFAHKLAHCATFVWLLG